MSVGLNGCLEGILITVGLYVTPGNPGMTDINLEALAKRAEGSLAAERTLSEKLSDQGELLGGALKKAPEGFKTAAKEALEHPGDTTVMMAASFGLGVAVSLVSRRPDLLGKTLAPVVEKTMLHGGKLLTGAALVDVSYKTATPAYEVWKDHNKLESSQALLGARLGRSAFDYSLNLGAGASGFLTGARVGRFAELAAKTAPDFKAFEGIFSKRGVTMEQLPANVRPENFLGRGGNGAVYKLDFTDDFVVKVPEFATKSPKSGPLQKVDDIMPEANIGQPVAKMGDYLILKKQNGFAAGAPDTRSRRAMTPEAAEAVYARSINESAALPQSAYDELAVMMVQLEKRGLQFDPSKPGNILIDPAAKRFNLVDISPTSSTNPRHHTVSDIIVPLMDNYFTGSVLSDKGVKYRAQLAQIIDKATKAARTASMHPAGAADSSLQYSYKLAGLTPP